MLFATAASIRDNPPAGVIERVEMAIILYALATIGPEINTTANDANRQRWANYVLSSVTASAEMARRMLPGILQTAPVVTKLDGGQGVADADITAAIAAVIDGYAGRI